jgi:hypothetical protein
LFARSIKEQVFGLEISVDDVVAVAVVDGREYLLDNVCRVLLAEILLLSDSLE